MASSVRALGIAMVVVAELFGVSATATADSVEPLTIVLTVLNQAQVPERILSRAKAECDRIYRALGVTLIWSDTIDSSARPQMSVNIVSKPFGARLTIPDSLAIKVADARVLGVAPGYKERRDLTVWAFYERIEDTAILLALDSGLLLGHIIAHEMGHVLLPDNSHSQTGLMRAAWDKSQAATAVTSNVRFTPGESALIRLQAARMTAAGRHSPTSASPTPHVPQPEDRPSSHRPIAAR